MPNKTLLSSAEKTREAFEKAKKEYSQADALLKREIDVSVRDPRQLQEMHAVIQKSGDNITRFHKQCEALLLAMDQVCRPMLSKAPEAYAVRAVVLLTEEIIKEMDATVTDFQVRINGAQFGSVGSITAEASTLALAMQTFWQQQYRMMPDYEADRKRIINEQREKENREKAELEQEVTGILLDKKWRTVQEIQQELWERYTRQQISATLRILVSQGKVDRIEDKRYAYFATSGTPRPKIAEEEIPQPAEQIVSEEAAAEEELANQKPKQKRPSWILISVAVVLLAVTVAGIIGFLHIKAQQEEQYRAAMISQIQNKMQTGVKEAAAQTLIFTTEEIAFMEDVGFSSFDAFYSEYARELVAERFSELYNQQNFDGIIDLAVFLTYNHADSFIGERHEIEIVFHKDFLNFLSDEIRNRAGKPEVFMDTTLTVGDRAFFVSQQFIYLEVPVGDTTRSVMFGTPNYRDKHYEDYNEDPYGICLTVGAQVERTEYKDMSIYPATCPRCGTSFRANTVYVKSIVEDGYCGFAGCGED